MSRATRSAAITIARINHALNTKRRKASPRKYTESGNRSGQITPRGNSGWVATTNGPLLIEHSVQDGQILNIVR